MFPMLESMDSSTNEPTSGLLNDSTGHLSTSSSEDNSKMSGSLADGSGNASATYASSANILLTDASLTNKGPPTDDLPSNGPSTYSTQSSDSQPDDEDGYLPDASEINPSDEPISELEKLKNKSLEGHYIAHILVAMVVSIITYQIVYDICEYLIGDSSYVWLMLMFVLMVAAGAVLVKRWIQSFLPTRLLRGCSKSLPYFTGSKTSLHDHSFLHRAARLAFSTAAHRELGRSVKAVGAAVDAVSTHHYHHTHQHHIPFTHSESRLSNVSKSSHRHRCTRRMSALLKGHLKASKSDASNNTGQELTNSITVLNKSIDNVENEYNKLKGLNIFHEVKRTYSATGSIVDTIVALFRVFAVLSLQQSMYAAIKDAHESVGAIKNHDAKDVTIDHNPATKFPSESPFTNFTTSNFDNNAPTDTNDNMSASIEAAQEAATNLETTFTGFSEALYQLRTGSSNNYAQKATNIFRDAF